MVGLSRNDVWMADVELSGGLGAVPRRRRSALERRRVVEETLEAGASVARVALKYGINANQVFQWRRLYRDGKQSNSQGPRKGYTECSHKAELRSSLQLSSDLLKLRLRSWLPSRVLKMLQVLAICGKNYQS